MGAATPHSGPDCQAHGHGSKEASDKPTAEVAGVEIQQSVEASEASNQVDTELPAPGSSMPTTIDDRSSPTETSGQSSIIATSPPEACASLSQVASKTTSKNNIEEWIKEEEVDETNVTGTANVSNNSDGPSTPVRATQVQSEVIILVDTPPSVQEPMIKRENIDNNVDDSVRAPTTSSSYAATVVTSSQPPATSTTVPGFVGRYKLKLPTKASALKCSQILNLIPPTYVPLRTSANDYLCGLETLAKLAGRVLDQECNETCPACMQANQGTALLLLKCLLNDPESLDRRTALGIGQSVTEAEFTQDGDELRETEFLSVQSLYALLIMLFEDRASKSKSPDSNGFKLCVVTYDILNDCVTGAHDIHTYGNEKHVFHIRVVGAHYEPWGSAGPTGEESFDGHPLTVTPYMQWAHPMYNASGVPRDHAHGPHALEEIFEEYAVAMPFLDAAYNIARNFETNHPESLDEETADMTSTLSQTNLYRGAQPTTEDTMPAKSPAATRIDDSSTLKHTLTPPTGPRGTRRRFSASCVGPVNFNLAKAPKAAASVPAPPKLTATTKPVAPGQAGGLFLDGLVLAELDVVRSPDRFLLAPLDEQLRTCEQTVHTGEVVLPISRLPFILQLVSVTEPAAADRFRRKARNAFFANTIYASGIEQVQAFYMQLCYYVNDFPSVQLPPMVLHLRLRPKPATIRPLNQYKDMFRAARTCFTNARIEILVPTSENTREKPDGGLTQTKPIVSHWTSDPAELFRQHRMPPGRKS